MLTVMQAIADFEGFNIPGSRAQRNNNPGNINFSAFAQQFGAVLETIPDGFEERPRFACFPNGEAGFDCLRALLNDDYANMTVLEAFNKYAPPSENSTLTYAEYVSKETGLALSDVLTSENIG